MSVQLDSLRRYVANRPPAPLERERTGVLAVASGKGGVGTSTLAGLVAVMGASDGLEVLLVDADESHGSLSLLLGTEPPHPLEMLRGGRVNPEELLVPLGHGLTLLCAGTPDGLRERLAPAERRALLRRLEALYPAYDLVVVDAGSRLQQILLAASSALRLLAVTLPERIAGAATYALVKAVDARFERLAVDLVVNRCRLAAATDTHAEIDGATRHFLDLSIGFAGAVPDDERLRQSLESGLPLQDVAALGTPAASACHELAARITRQLDQGSSAVLAPRLSHRR